jgi:hypothetical protein
MGARVVARTQLTDLRPGGEIAQLLGAFAQEMAAAHRHAARIRDARNPGRAVGRDLVDYAAELGVVPRGPQRATGYVVFERSTGTGAVSVDAGTVVASAAGVAYQTTAAVTLLSGETTSPSVPVVAQRPGEAGNADAGLSLRVVSPTAGGLTARSVTSMQGGLEGESTESLRAAIAAVPRSVARCNRTAIVNRALQAALPTGQQVQFARVIPTAEPAVKLLVLDDGAGGLQAAYTTAPAEVLTASAAGGEFLFYLTQRPARTKPALYLNDALLAEGVDYTFSRPESQVFLAAPLAPGDELTASAYTHWTGLVAEANRLVYGDPADLVAFPPYVAEGGTLLVQGAKVQVPAFSAAITAKPGRNWDAVAAEVRSAWVAHINRLDIGAPLQDAALYAAGMNVRSRGVQDIDLLDWSDWFPPLDTALRIAADDITLVEGA